MLTAKQVPYTGPYSSDATELPHKGPTVVALKRMLVRLELMTAPAGGMLELTDRWPAGGKLDLAFRKWQRGEGDPGDGVYGQQEWKLARAERVPVGKPHAGEYALDKYARKLIRDEWIAGNTPDETDVRVALTWFCLAAEANEDNWHYRQYRPVDVSVDPKASYVSADCSSYVIMAYHWAKTKTGLNVPDPAKMDWSGYGNTDLYEDDHPRVSAPFKVGDLAHYPGHVTICRRAGDTRTAVFSSHGSEAGPIPTSLNYRGDLRFVVRPPLIA